MVDMIDQVDAMPMETGGCDNEPVEMAVFEQDKENIRPARAGRNPAKLAEAVLRQHDVDECSSGAHSFDDARKMERQDFESRVALLAEATARSPQKDDDEAFTRGTTGALVQLWANYARWAAEWYPADCHEERSVLERATSNLADRPNCFEDLQHLRLWLRLADFSQEPQDLFSFLWTRGIGLTHASLYEAWSASLERQHRFEEAEEALQVGRARGAQPVDRLAALCEAFAARMRARVLRSAEDGFESMVGQDVRALGRMLPGSADPFFMQRDELVPAPLQRPTLNVLTAAEGQGLVRPTERSVQQQGTGLEPASGIVKDLFPQLLACLDESSGSTPPRASIFDAQAAWLVPPSKECVASKENAGPRASSIADPCVGSRRPRNANRQRRRDDPEGDALAIFVDEELQDEHFSPPARRSRTNAEVMSRAPLAGAMSSGSHPSALSMSDAATMTNASATPPQQSSGTPPQQSGRSNSTPNSTARPAPPQPPAPNRDLRRQRPATPEELADMADDLLAGLSSLRLSDKPPVKRARAQGMVVFEDA